VLVTLILATFNIRLTIRPCYYILHVVKPFVVCVLLSSNEMKQLLSSLVILSLNDVTRPRDLSCVLLLGMLLVTGS